MLSTKDAMTTIEAMLEQEAKYLSPDYLFQSSPQRASVAAPLHAVDVDCRSKMVSWCFQVVDFW